MAPWRTCPIVLGSSCILDRNHHTRSCFEPPSLPAWGAVRRRAEEANLAFQAPDAGPTGATNRGRGIQPRSWPVEWQFLPCPGESIPRTTAVAIDHCQSNLRKPLSGPGCYESYYCRDTPVVGVIVAGSQIPSVPYLDGCEPGGIENRKRPRNGIPYCPSPT